MGVAMTERKNVGVVWSLEPGDTLLRQGTPGACLYLIKAGFLKGEVALPDGKVRLSGIYGQGDLLGVAALTGAEHLETAVALTKCVVEMVDPHWSFGGGDHRQNLADALGRQIRRAQKKVIESNLSAGSPRITAMFLDHAERFGFEKGGYAQFDVPLTHTEFAGLVNTSRTTATTIIGKLKREGGLDSGLDLGSFKVNRERLEEILRAYVLEAI